MKRELTPNEIIFSASCNDTTNLDSDNRMSEIKTALNKLKKALNIDKEGYNIYYIDSFSKEKLENLQHHIEKIYKDCDPPKDICYVIGQDELTPKPMFLPNGKGRILKDMVDDIKGKYLQCVINFYQDSSEDENSSKHLGFCQRLLFGQKSTTPLNPRRQPDGFLRTFPRVSETPPRLQY